MAFLRFTDLLEVVVYQTQYVQTTEQILWASETKEFIQDEIQKMCANYLYGTIGWRASNQQDLSILAASGRQPSRRSNIIFDVIKNWHS